MNAKRSSKTAAKAASSCGRGAASATRYTITHWRGLLPLLCIAASMVFAAAAQVFAWAYGPWAWAWIGVVALVLFVWADGWVGTLTRPSRPPAIAFVLFTAASAVGLIVAGAMIEAYMTVVAAGVLLGTWWWNGRAYQAHRCTERSRRAMETVLSKLGISEATRITKVNVSADGTREWRLYLGDHDRPEQIKAADVAHLLKTCVDRIIIRSLERGSSRSLKIVELAASPEKSLETSHPATKTANRAAGAAWEPGVRSIIDGLATGGVLGSAEESRVRVYTENGDSRCVMMLGKSGSGKTNTTSAALLSALACNDLVIGVCDIPKTGNLGLPFAPGLHRLARTAEELEADLQGLYNLASDRCARLARGEIYTPEGKRARNWVPTAEEPAVLYAIDELANTLLHINSSDPDQAEHLWDLLIGLVQFVRQAGIILLPISQTAKRDMIRPDFTSQMGTYVVHQLKKAADAGDIWQGLDVNFLEAGLPKVGMALVGSIDGDEPATAMSFDMDTPIGDEATWGRLIADYAGHRPHLSERDAATLGWGNTLLAATATDGDKEMTTTDAAAPATTEDTGREQVRLGLLADAVTDTDIPDGAGIITGPDLIEEGDDDRQRAILDALLDADDEGLSRAAIERSVDLSTSTTKRLLAGLQDDQRVTRVGKGKATRYRIAAGALSAA